MSIKISEASNKCQYYRISKVVGKRVKEHGREATVRKNFRGKRKKEAEDKFQVYLTMAAIVKR
ncbi:hypothetical protein AALA22_02625 [Anaerovoracaceae bacterium 41-7]